MKPKPILVLGAGWAGLAAGVELAARGYSVQILESARQPGGRARCVRFGELNIDNGQHLLIGAYRETLRLMESIGLRESDLFARTPLRLAIRGDGQDLDLASLPLPSPMHIGGGLLRARGLSLRQRSAAVKMAYRLWRRKFALAEDCTVALLLEREGQNTDLTRRLWEPLCLATLNTPIARASARAFLAVLRDAFTGNRGNADLLIPRTGLGRIFPVPAVDFIEQRGGHVQLGRRANRLLVEDNRIIGIETGDQTILADQVVLAVPPITAARLLQPHAALADTAERLFRLSYESITTIYLHYPQETRLPAPMLGMVGTYTQWVFDRSICGQPGLIAAVISADGPHLSMENRQLITAVSDELSRLLPGSPPPLNSTVIREKRATFACEAGVDSLRPRATTPVRGLWLAGDYTATGYPATLEGAVRSGVQCARHIMDNAGPLPTS
ncbi:hydroxysqualene dehydroxylase HpnE [Thiohalomonas denitrificans]|uniref:Squalene-associated FAD-dependent desaturase n=1 Tax=Thiohalomonas denitrificans TaxID=415747 RepID=A0A1G5PIE4_9GAMM|nr:hydroxysqualene dehydroxylase HpnE [Thiohalomonas denitrificans]SCZ49264.1 squalene-associated FAD-dependent desaturase [Thiohalomonas denitrificans]